MSFLNVKTKEKKDNLPPPPPFASKYATWVSAPLNCNVTKKKKLVLILLLDGREIEVMNSIEVMGRGEPAVPVM